MRIPYPDTGTLSAAKLAQVDQAGPELLNISRILLHLPEGLWAAQRAFGRATIYDSTISERLQEIAIVRIGYILDSDYELHHHLSIARALAIPEKTLEVLRDGDFSELEAKEEALAQFVTELVSDVKPSDETLSSAKEHFSDSQIFEVIAITGHYMMVARFIAVSDLPLDDSPVTGWPNQGPKSVE